MLPLGTMILSKKKFNMKLNMRKIDNDCNDGDNVGTHSNSYWWLWAFPGDQICSRFFGLQGNGHLLCFSFVIHGKLRW